MGTTAQKLQAIANSKAAIKAAIEAKGVSDVGNVLSTYATKIASIPAGASGDLRYEVTTQGALNKKSFVIDWFDDLTSIPDYGLQYAYQGSNVTSASFPNLKTIGVNGLQQAFSNCTSLTNIDLSSVERVTNNNVLQGICQGCTSLTSVDLTGMTSLGGMNALQNGFNGCTSLTSIDLSSLTSIGSQGFQYAFMNCTALRTIYLTKLSSASSAFIQAFYNCTHLELVDFSEATAVPALNNVNAFNNTNNYYEIRVPNALYDTWVAATNWSNSSIAPHIQKAEQGLKFTAAQAGSTITLNAVGTPPSISLMYSTDDGKTFNAYTVGTTITLANVGDSVRFKAGSGGNTAFATDDSNYHQFTMTGNISYSSPMESLWWLLDPMGIAPSSFAQKAFLKLFKDCGVLHGEFDFSIFTTIPTDALRETFNSCLNMRGLDLSSLTSVENSGLNSAFYQCPSLTSVDLSNLTSVGYEGLRSAFRGCTSLTNVYLTKLSSVGSIGMGNAFQNCTSLTNVYLTKLSSVGNNGLNSAFNGCTALEIVDFSQATAVPTMSNINTFSNTNNTFKIVVPDALYNDWIVATNWSTYASKIVKVSDYTPTI